MPAWGDHRHLAKSQRRGLIKGRGSGRKGLGTPGRSKTQRQYDISCARARLIPWVVQCGARLTRFPAVRRYRTIAKAVLRLSMSETARAS
jgi:hypothetical protein